MCRVANLRILGQRDLSSLVQCGSGGAPLPVGGEDFERKTK